MAFSELSKKTTNKYEFSNDKLRRNGQKSCNIMKGVAYNWAEY